MNKKFKYMAENKEGKKVSLEYDRDGMLSDALILLKQEWPEFSSTLKSITVYDPKGRNRGGIKKTPDGKWEAYIIQ